MNEGQLPTFSPKKVYLLKGATLTNIVESIIKEILVDGVLVSKPFPNKARIDFIWKSVVDCDAEEYQIPTAPPIQGPPAP